MTSPLKAHHAAWGLGLRSGGADLLRVMREGDGAIRVERCQSYELPEFWQAGAANAELAAALNQINPDEPLGICFPDRAVLCRALSLPSARPAVVQRMIEAQVDALLPSGGERLSWTSCASADPLRSGMQWVVLCAARRDLLEQVERVVPQGLAAQALMPRVVAMSYALRHSQSTPAAFQFFIDVCDDSVTMALVTEGRLFRCAMLDRDSAAQDVPDKAVAGGWVMQLQPAYQALVDGIPAERLPRQGIVSCADDQADLVATLETVLKAELRPWSESLEPKLSSATALGAYGVAELLLDHAAGRSINFAKVAQPAAAAAVRPRRLLGIAAGCLLGVVLLYGLDCWRGRWLTGEVERLRGIENAGAGLERRLAINKYLEKNAPPAMPMLDALLAAAPPSLQMTSIGVNASNQLHFTGVLNNPSELDDFLHRLQQSPALANVELRSGRADAQQPQQRWDVDLTAEAAPMAGLQLASNVNASPLPGVQHGASASAVPHPRATTSASTTRGSP